MYNAITRKVRCAGAAQGFLLSRGGMEPMKPVFFVLFCFVFFLPCVCVFPVHTCELCKGKKTKNFPFLAFGQFTPVSPRVSFCICVAHVSQA